MQAGVPPQRSSAAVRDHRNECPLCVGITVRDGPESALRRKLRLMGTPMSDAESEKPEVRRANDNPWYCLATLYGEQAAAARNRMAWNLISLFLIRPTPSMSWWANE
jgi:hypothetical protein